MQKGPRTPLPVIFCNLMIRIASQLVPAARRDQWKQEWIAEIRYRWQFLFYAREWSWREALQLVRKSSGAFAQAAWCFVSQDAIQSRARQWVRSPWVYLGGWTTLLLFLALLSPGLPATRDLFFSQSNQNSGRLLFLWLHPITGGGDKALPPDVAADWRTHSHLLESVAAFNMSQQLLLSPGGSALRPLVIATEPTLFQVLRVRPALGELPRYPAIVLDHRVWVSLFHANPNAVGSRVRLGDESYRVAAVLPAGFRFLSRQPSVYLVRQMMADPRVMVVARAKPGATGTKLNEELTRISEDVSSYFFGSGLRLGFIDTQMLTPLRFFGVAVLIAALLAVACRARLRHMAVALNPKNRTAAARRALFFLAKTSLALAFVFAAGLEWSRSQSSILLASKDPATGPFLLWLYMLGAMGVLFWSVADQRARCRVCLRLLCFPVRIGCPGCLLLEWSGTELACTEGHGVLHVPHLAPSWEEESQRWISLDESWRGLFADTK